MNSSETTKPSSENIISEKWDKCTARLLVNSGIGLATGIVCSVLFFRRRFWPLPASVGFAAGVSYQECKQNFAPESIPLPGQWIKAKKE